MLSKEMRSLAAKKGWETRRANMLKKKSLEAAMDKGPVASVDAGPGIETFFGDKGMAQIYTNGLEFAWVSAEKEQCHAFAYCKDFLQDAVWAVHNKATGAIWGFSYTFGKNPLVDIDNMRLALRLTECDNGEFEAYCKNILKFMNDIEEDMGVDKTVLTYGGEYTDKDSPSNKHAGKATWVFCGAKVWMRSTYHISAYSLLLRAGMKYDGKGWKKHLESGEMYGKNDRGYINSATKGIMEIVEDKELKLFAHPYENNFPPGVNTNILHNNGIVQYSKGAVNDSFKKFW